MKATERGSIFLKYLERIQTTDLTVDQQLKAYYRLFTLMLEEASDEERINFTTLFSRIAYIGAKYKLDGSYIFLLHSLRRGIENELIEEKNQQQYLNLARYTCTSLMTRLFGIKVAFGIKEKELLLFFRHRKEAQKGFYQILRGLVLEVYPEERRFIFVDERDGVKEWEVRYDISHKNEIFTSNINSLGKYYTLPVHINLIDVEWLEGDVLVPKAFVIEPDYLVDVTAIANTFKYYGTEPLEALIKKYKPLEMSIYLLLGNIANYLLDEVVNRPEITFEELIPSIFHLSPLTFACMDDHHVVQTLQKARMHFDHLKHVSAIAFKKEDIDTSQVYLEPSYYSRDYGIQGRLDLLHEHKYNRHFDIVELKSGSPFRPNNYGLSVQHYTQTLLYDLIIKSVYRGGRKTSNYILYSKEEDWQLRNAPVLRVQQYEALKVRNDLLLLENLLCDVDDAENDLFQKIRPEGFPKAKGFLQKDVELFNNIYQSLDQVEKSYFKSFSAFVAREHKLAKVGEHGLSKSNGLAALWLEDVTEKTDRFSILNHLKIIDNQSDNTIPLIQLSKTDHTPQLSRFRKGDIVVLYPHAGNKSILKNQIFKCTIIDLEEDNLWVKLRSRQYNHRIFEENKYWAIEGDMMDSSFITMYRNIFQWASSDREYRELMLGREAPKKGKSGYLYYSEELTEEQNHLLNQIIHSKDYYLLWGPPGTGKTSVMIKHLVKYLYFHTDENILLLAYTNRAVDEICAATMHALGGDEKGMIRIGSYNSCNENFRPFLLDEKIKDLNQRKEIIKLLKESRITISTVSSIVNRIELFHLYQFDTCIIDEASQILEPMIIGLLSQFERFIMIGDHKQLPAVVVQDNRGTKVVDEHLTRVGITDLSMSLFERLYLYAKKNNWDYAYGILTAQGRMHADLMKFPNEYFYESRLKLIPGIERLTSDDPLATEKECEHLFFGQRLIYIDASTDEGFSWKTNLGEAKNCIQIIDAMVEFHKKNGLPWNINTLGIITPYRAQIALIKAMIDEKLDRAMATMITVDTVERYQGGARDNIILSLCTNRVDQLEKLVSLSSEGVDRKLNVALTRARERLIITGNKDILQHSDLYGKLILACHKIELPESEVSASSV